MENTLKNYVIDAMIDEISPMDGTKVCGCDLGYALFEGANINGSFTCNANESKEFVKTYFDELGEVVEDIKFNLGAESIPNVFDNVEAFQVVIMLEVSDSLCSECSFINDNWNNEIELTEENIKLIISQLEELRD